MRRSIRGRSGGWSSCGMIGVLLCGLAACAGGSGFPKPASILPIPDIQSLFPFPTPRVCLSGDGLSLKRLTDLAREAYVFKSEEASIESALDRVSTVRSNGEVNHIMMMTLPISGGSDWPQGVSEMPLTEEAKLRERMRQDPANSGRDAALTSVLKVKTLYRQTLLFTRYPDFFAWRKPGVAQPSEAEVQTYQLRVLGANSPPAFNKNFYRFLRDQPDYEPKAELFAGRLDGKATEVYPSLHDAVVSLAENTNEIRQLREVVLQAEEKKARENRDILDLEQQIMRLEATEFGNPSTADEAARASERDTNANQVNALKEQLAVQRREFESTVRDYLAEIERLGLEMARIKTQAMAFTPEQQALAKNIQVGVGAVKGTMCESQLLLAMAGYHLQKVGSNWQHEIQGILHQGGQAAIERMRRVALNGAMLPTMLSVLKTEADILEKEVKVYDGLFESRIGGGGSWWNKVPGQ